jgi:hypothetical protein
MTAMQPKQQTVKIRLQIGPGLPRDVAAFHEPHALRAILKAFYDAMTNEKLYAESVFTGTSNGVSAYLSPTHLGIHAEPTLPTTHYIECVGTVKLQGKEAREIEPALGQIFLFPIERAEIEAMRRGSRHEAIVPVLPDFSERLKPGASVTFYEATADPSGDPIPVPEGDRLTVTLLKVTDQNYPWVGRRLYSIVWDPNEAAKGGRHYGTSVKRSHEVGGKT